MNTFLQSNVFTILSFRGGENTKSTMVLQFSRKNFILIRLSTKQSITK